MDRVINVEILGRPVNAIIIILMIVLFWFAFYSVAGRAFVRSVVPAEKDENK